MSQLFSAEPQSFLWPDHAVGAALGQPTAASSQPQAQFPTGGVQKVFQYQTPARGQVFQGVTASRHPVTFALDKHSSVSTVQQPQQFLQPTQAVQLRHSAGPQLQQVRTVPAFVQTTGNQVVQLQHTYPNNINQAVVATHTGSMAMPATALLGSSQGMRGPLRGPSSNLVAVPGHVGLQGRPQVLNHTTVAVRPAVVQQSTAIVPTMTTFAATNAMPGQRTTIRVPKLGTVATYNPSTGHLNGNVAVANPVAVPGVVPQAPKVGVLQPHQPTMAQAQRAAQPPVFTSIPGPATMTSSAHRVVSVTLPNGASTTTVVDQGNLPHVMDSQPRQTVIKVPVSAATSLAPSLNPASVLSSELPLQLAQLRSLDRGSRSDEVVPMVLTNLPTALSNHDAHVVTAASAAALNTVSPSLLSAALNLAPRTASTATSTAASYNAALTKVLNLQQLLQQPPGNNPAVSAPPASLDMQASTDLLASLPADHQPSGGGDALDLPAVGASDGIGEMKAILTSIGAELARHGISVESAITAGWLGTLSAEDMHVLLEAYAVEEKRLVPAGHLPEASVGNAAVASTSSNIEASGPEAGSSSGPLPAVSGGKDRTHFSAYNYNFFGSLSADEDAMVQALEGDEQGVPGEPRFITAPVSTWMQLTADGTSAEFVRDMDTGTSNRFFSGKDSASEMEHAEEGHKVDLKRNALSAHQNNMLGTEVSARFANLDLGCGFI